MARTTWTVPGTVIKVVDGDTIKLKLDLGWRVDFTANCRILGINCPEVDTPEGLQAKGYAEHVLPVGALVTFVSHELDKYGRPLGNLIYDGKDFGTQLLNAGHAKVLTY